MSQCAVGEGQFVNVPALSDEATDKVARPDIVHEIAKELAAQRVVPEVLNHAATVSVAVCDLELFRGGCGILRQQKWFERILPSQIIERFVGEEPISG